MKGGKKIAVFTYVEGERVLPSEIIEKIEGFDGLSARGLYFAALASQASCYDQVIVCLPIPPLRAEIENLGRFVGETGINLLFPLYNEQGQLVGFSGEVSSEYYPGVSLNFESLVLKHLLKIHSSSSLVHFSYYDTGVGSELGIFSSGDARSLCDKLKFRELMEKTGLGGSLLPATVFSKGERIEALEPLKGKFLKLPTGTSGEGIVSPEVFKAEGIAALLGLGVINKAGFVVSDFYAEEDGRRIGDKCRQISVKFLKYPEGSLLPLSIHTNIEENFKHLGVVIPSSPDLLGISKGSLDRLLDVTFEAARVVGGEMNFGEINFDCLVLKKGRGEVKVFITDPNIRTSNSSVGLHLAALIDRSFRWLRQERMEFNSQISNLQQAEKIIKRVYQDSTNTFPYATSTVVESLLRKREVASCLVANIL